METSDNVIAVGGTVGIVNGCTIKNGQVMDYKLPRNFLARLQVVMCLSLFVGQKLLRVLNFYLINARGGSAEPWNV